MVMQGSPLVVLTRPQGKNQVLAGSLRRQGVSVLELPALQLRPAPVVPGQLPFPADYDLVVFVSTMALSAYESALRHYASSDQDAALPTSARFVAAVGPATVQALGKSPLFGRAHIIAPPPSAGSDSEGLWQALQPFLPDLQRALIVRGQTGREWLGGKLEEAGLSVTRYASYQRSTVSWSVSDVLPLKQHLHSMTQPQTVWLLSSAEATDSVFEQLDRHCLSEVLRSARYVAVHERIAQRLKCQYARLFPDNPPPEVTLCAPDVSAILRALVSVATDHERALHTRT